MKKLRPFFEQKKKKENIPPVASGHIHGMTINWTFANWTSGDRQQSTNNMLKTSLE